MLGGDTLMRINMTKQTRYDVNSGYIFSDYFILWNRACVHIIKLLFLYVFGPLFIFFIITYIINSNVEIEPVILERSWLAVLVVIYFLAVIAVCKHIDWREKNIAHLLVPKRGGGRISVLTGTITGWLRSRRKKGDTATHIQDGAGNGITNEHHRLGADEAKEKQYVGLEPIVENRYTQTKEFHKEMMKRKNLSKPVLAYIIIIIASTLQLVIFELNNPGMYSYVEFIMWGFLNVPVVFLIIRYIRSVKLGYPRDLEANNGQPIEVRLILTSEGVDVSYGGCVPVSHTSYQKIRNIIGSRNYYYLIAESRNYIAFKKDGFVKGTQDEFLALLRSKGFRC